MDRRHFTKTSSGAGHVYIHPQALHTHSFKNSPLPPLLRRHQPGALHYNVTSYTEHGPKPADGVLSNVICSKAPPHWRTHFLNDLAQKLRDSQSLRLAPEPPVSEMQEQYRGRSAPHKPPNPHFRTLQALHGQLHQSSVMLPKEPALSTAHTDYRRFSRSELVPFSTLDVPPTCGPFTNYAALIRRHPHKAPPSAPSQLQLPSQPVPVPHGSRSSVYMDSFSVPVPPPMSSTHASTKRTEESERSLLQHILGVPEMYGTENQAYGKGRLVLV